MADGGIIETQKISRHRAFWRREEVDRPIAGVYLGSFLRADIYAAAREGQYLSPEQLAPERFTAGLDAEAEALACLDHDLIFPAQVISSVPWLEGMLGCPVQVQAHSVWAEPVLKADQPIEEFAPGWDPAWLEAAAACIRGLAAHFHPRLPVAGPFLRGPADVVAALIGADRLCVEVIDHPAEIHRLCRLCAQAWMRASQELAQWLPKWNGGHVLGARWLWAPGGCTYCSEDITCILSAKIYREFFLPYNRVMARQIPYGFVHRHSPSAHHLEALLELPPGWAVEVTMDPTGPRVGNILPVLQRIQAAGRPLIVFGLTDPDEVGRLVEGLSPRGLCVTVQAAAEDEARILLQAIRKESPHLMSTR